ncbi:MAG: efflux RND transporter permease subunit [Rhodocyclaceae bacterium]|nr:efflux RND transporter permease subunit [Rhodocyclaceae bacterium]
MKGLNLSQWALAQRALTLHLIVVLLLSGFYAFLHLGRAEDPDFTFKAMVVRTLWPGATAREVEQQVTERIERKLQEIEHLDLLKSISRAGESLIFIQLADTTPKATVPEAWRQVRRKLDDLAPSLPAGVLGPFPNEEFGDVYVSIYAVVGEGFDAAELRRAATRLARDLRLLPDVKKVDLLGVQEEKIYVEIPPQRLASLGLTPAQVAATIHEQNALTAAGFIETESDRLYLRVTGPFDSVDAIRAIDLSIAGRSVRLGDIAQITRGFADPPNPRMRVNGRDAVGVAVAMAKGGDVIALGQHLYDAVLRAQATLPAGLEIINVFDQPTVVRVSLDLFLKTLLEALAIVLAVSFLSLGLRTGLVVALSIPLVLAITFLAMKSAGIDLHRVSLGALIIALGLLVDDAIISVEMMAVKIEQGWEKAKAATFAYVSTAFPMLTGTLITAAAFTPVGFARSAAGEYAFAIFGVTAIALISSWFVAVIFTPYLGFHLLDEKALRKAGAKRHGDIYDTPFYRRFRALVAGCLRRRGWVIGLTLAAFLASLLLFKYGVQYRFFPPSNRTELIVDLWLPQGASRAATEKEVRRVEALLAAPELADKIVSYSSWIGNGAPRFYLPLDQQLFYDHFGQLVITTRNLDAREEVRTWLLQTFASPAQEFSHLRTRVQRLENGPPVGYPVVFRVLGEDAETLRAIAARVAEVMRAHPNLVNVHADWHEKAKSVRIRIDQDRARALGISSRTVAQALASHEQGVILGQYREGDQLIDIVWRADETARNRLAALEQLPVPTAQGQWLPLSQIAKIEPAWEESVIHRRNRVPVIQVRADLLDERLTAPTVSRQVDRWLDDIRKSLPPGYRIEMGGMIEEAAKNEAGIQAVVPFMILAVITLLMFQLRSFARTLLALLTAPLGLIGVALALFLFRAPYGFVANLGVIALAGMILRNTVILIDQIEQDERAGVPPWEAIVGATVRRFRPIMLTAAAAVLAMIPLSRQIFWGPMAIAIMGGLVVATVLTLFFLPALYAAWRRIPAPSAGA